MRQWPLRRALILAAAILAAACCAAGCSHTSSIRAHLSPATGISTASRPATPTTDPATPTTAPATPTTAPPTTAPATPTTAPASATSAPATAASTPAGPTPASSATPGPGTGSVSRVWLWAALATLAAVVLIALVTGAARRRSARARAWRSAVVDAYARGSALHDAVAAAGRSLLEGGEGAGTRWADIQRRADDLTQVLYRLHEAAPGGEERTRVAEVLAALQALRSALEAGRGPAGGLDPDVIRSRLRYFEESLQELRGPR